MSASASTSLEQHLAAAVEAAKIPHAVVCATNRDGTFQYSHATGKTSVDTSSDSAAQDIREDAVFLLASQTKLLTAFAAMIVVEKGLIGLDEDVTAVGLLPELGAQKVLVGFEGDGEDGEDGRAVLEERRGKVTLRHLLTHTAGTAYDAAHPKLIRWKSQQQQQDNKTNNEDSSPFASATKDVPSRFSYPLISQPGEAWSYGPALDWAGLLIERLTNSTLEAFMRKHIWDPLNLPSMTFFPEKKGLQTRVPEISVRGPDGGLHPFREPFINTGVTGCFGGHGAYSSMGDYIKFLRQLLVNDGTILRRETVDLLFQSQLTAPQAASLKEFFQSPLGAFFIGEFDLDRYKHGWSFGGILFLQKYEDGRRGEGSVSWGGVANSFWLLDRGAGVALSFGTQVIPPGDLQVSEVIGVVEREVYKMTGVV